MPSGRPDESTSVNHTNGRSSVNLPTRSLRVRRASGIIAASALAFAGVVGVQAPANASVTKVSNTTDTKCSIFTYHTPTDWYFPSGTPTALVWLQHGFSETKNEWNGYANELANAGYLVVGTTLASADLFGCTVSNIGNNTPYLNNVADVFGKKNDPNEKLGRSFTNAKNTAGRSSLAMPTNMVFVGHSAGAEVVAYVANRIHTNYAGTFPQVKGVVFADGVNSFTGLNMANGLNGLYPTNVPVYATASPPYSCNNNQSGTTELKVDFPGRFHGALINTGAHQDIFGSDATGVETLTCGTPQSQNISAARGLTTAWIGDMVSGIANPANYPGGSYFQSLVGAGTITALP